MGYAILRTAKLKSTVSIHRSMKHAFREQETPNADPDLTPNNTHIGASCVREGMAAFRSRIPDKVRKNAVLAIEYLITGSPEDINGKTREEQDKYFTDALEWLKNRHGAENVVYAGIHRDETTPHMYAYVVPIDNKQKLNCRAFLGGSKALNEMQSDFAEKVGEKHGLQRGIAGSKAKHTRISQFYGEVNKPIPAPLKITEEDLKPQKLARETFFEKTFGVKETNLEIALRLNEIIETFFEPLKQKVQLFDLKARETLESKKTTEHTSKLLTATQRRLKHVFDGITEQQSNEILKIAEKFRNENKEREDLSPDVQKIIDDFRDFNGKQQENLSKSIKTNKKGRSR